jgi:hypothetical protein
MRTAHIFAGDHRSKRVASRATARMMRVSVAALVSFVSRVRGEM